MPSTLFTSRSRYHLILKTSVHSLLPLLAFAVTKLERISLRYGLNLGVHLMHPA